MFNKLIIILTLCLAFSLITTAEGTAQRRGFVQELERFDREFERVKELVNSFSNDRARQSLQEARTLRNAADEAFRNGRLTEAGSKLKLAFGKLAVAAKVTLDGPAKRWRNRLEELLSRAEHEVLGCNHEEAQRILQEAKTQRDLAEHAAAALDVRKAIEHFRVAETAARRALQLIQSLQDKIREERYRFEVLRDRAQELVEKSSNARAKQIFRQAIKLAVSAEEALHGCRIEVAKKFYNQSVMLLLRAMDLARGDSKETINQVEAAFFRLRELMEATTECVRNSSRPQAKLLLERARRFANEAELAAKNQHRYQALWKIELAENMLRRACRISKGRGGQKISARIARQIENAKMDIAETRRNVDADFEKDAAVLIKMAEFTIRKAEQAASAGFNRFALASVLATQRFLTKAQRMLRTPETNPISQENIRIKLIQLDEAIAESEARIQPTSQEWNRRFLNGAKDIRKFVDDSVQKGNYRAADEAIRVAFELVKKSWRNLPKD